MRKKKGTYVLYYRCRQCKNYFTLLEGTYEEILARLFNILGRGDNAGIYAMHQCTPTKVGLGDLIGIKLTRRKKC